MLNQLYDFLLQFVVFFPLTILGIIVYLGLLFICRDLYFKKSDKKLIEISPGNPYPYRYNGPYGLAYIEAESANGALTIVKSSLPHHTARLISLEFWNGKEYSRVQ